MRCVDCHAPDTKVVDSRDAGDGVRRRRQCATCGARFSTQEQLIRQLPQVQKRDGRKEPFSREKVLHGLRLACRKRPVDVETLDQIVDRVEAHLASRRQAVVASAEVGQAVLEALKEVDSVAFIRFASVYQAFEDVAQFIDAIGPLKEPTPDA